MNLDEWIIANSVAIAEARGVSVEEVANEPGEISNQLARIRQHFLAMGMLKNDATTWVNKTRALAMQKIRNDEEKYTADERKLLSDADPDYLKALHIRGEIQATESALKSFHFELLNDRRTSYVPKMHDND